MLGSLRTASFRLAVLSPLAVAAACVGSDPATTTTTTDAGAVVDAGAVTDAGPSPVDAGPIDAATPDAGPPALPIPVANVAFWLDPDQITDPATAWPSRVGGLSFARPGTLPTTAPKLLQGPQNAPRLVRFDNGNTASPAVLMLTGSPPPGAPAPVPTGTTPFLYASVVRVDTAAANPTYLGGIAYAMDPNALGLQLYTGPTSSGPQGGFGATAGGASYNTKPNNPTISDGKLHLLVLQRAAGLFSIRIDGKAGSGAVSDGGIGAPSAVKFYLGGQLNGQHNRTVELGDQVFLNGDTTASDLASLEDYLMKRYGIPKLP